MRTPLPWRRIGLLFVLGLHPLAAFAHGEALLLPFVAGLAAVAGLATGAFAGLMKRFSRVPSPAWFLGYLALGASLAAIVLVNIQGAVLFLAFGGLGGALPFFATFHLAKAIGSWARKRWRARATLHAHGREAGSAADLMP